MKKVFVIIVLSCIQVNYLYASSFKDEASAYPPFNSSDSTSYKSKLSDRYRADSIKQAIATTRNAPVQSFIDVLLKRKEQVGKLLGLSNYYFPVYERVLKEFGLPEELKFLSVIESALNPHAVSRVGATGPWQFMAPTAKAYGLKINQEVDERKDPVQASKAAAAYLRDAFDQYGDWLLAIASYNCGRGAVSRAIAKAGGKADFWEISKFLPAETRNYVPKFLATAYIMGNYRQFDINPLAPSFNILTDVIDVIKPISLAAVARATGIDLHQLILLNPSYKKLMINGSAEAPKPLVIPANSNPDYFALYQVLNGSGSAGLAANPKNTGQSSINKTVYHIVKKGDNLSSIAKKYKGVSVEELKAWNKLRGTQLLVGKRLLIRQ